MTTLLTYRTPDYEMVYRKYLGPCVDRLKLKPHKNYFIEKRQIEWAGITRVKPTIILQELNKGNPVLYVDSDARITSRKVMDIDSIVPPEYVGAVVFLPWSQWCNSDSDVIEPLTGTLFFRPAAIPLIELWVKLCSMGDLPDNKYFMQVVDTESKDIFHLPIEWSYIETLPDGSKGGIKCDTPLIIQYQASRWMRYK